MELIEVYGLENCDTTKTAIKQLKQEGKSVELINLKVFKLTNEILKHWFAQKAWEKLLNKRSTTWKNLDKSIQEKVIDENSAIDIIIQYPTLLKRPILVLNNKVI
ncbi:MAG: ArsC/Spx/MgsR family protein [Chitinophagaceae bacterium]